MASEDLLDTFLSTAIEEFVEERIPQKTLKETDIFSKESNTSATRTEKSNKKLDIIHSGDTDSSDDEDNKYYEEQKYNECGKNVKHLLQATDSSKDAPGRSSSTWKNKPAPHELAVKATITENKTRDVYTDPIFGLRIINPLISSTTLQDRMTGREAVSFSRIKKFVAGNISDKNWVIAGVIANKSSVRTSQKGSQFLIWTLTDLKDDIKTVSVFLFGSAYKQLWKTATGVVLGILNPSVLDKKDGSKDEACLSVDNAQKVMIMGQSKDLGTCRSAKKNGEQCTAIVNVNRCEFCIYHIKQEYQKCSKRSELQSNFSGKGLTALRNKVLGKNEVFYAGKSYMAIPAKRSKKLEERDTGRLQSLCGTVKAATPLREKNPRKKKQVAANLEISQQQRIKDLALLEKLGGEGVKTDFKASHSAEVTLESSKSNALSVIAKLKAKNEQNKNEIVTPRPALPIEKSNNMLQLKMNGKEGVVDLNATVTPRQISRAKFNAVKYVKEHGALKKSDPNSVKKVPSESKKRPLDGSEEGKNPKKLKILENEFLSDRFKKMMETTSKHLDLLEDRDSEEQDKYFHKLEMKEKMEEKMVNTYKVACKAVRCLKCKYTNFSASQFCKDEKHPLRVSDAFKRFFKCGNCGNRTVSLDVVPVTACSNCGSGKWERTGMMKEKTATVTHNLSIRGGEQTFVNSVVTDSNLDLLVPEQ